MADETEHGWYDKGALIAGLYQVEAAGKRAVSALERLQQTAEYIKRMYGDEPDED